MGGEKSGSTEVIRMIMFNKVMTLKRVTVMIVVLMSSEIIMMMMMLNKVMTTLRMLKRMKVVSMVMRGMLTMVFQLRIG